VIRAGACLSPTTRFAPFVDQTANGLRLWADTSGVELTTVDDASAPAILTEAMTALAPTMDVLFGPYSTVLMRAVIPVAKAAGRRIRRCPLVGLSSAITTMSFLIPAAVAGLPGFRRAV
jgi:hypothetical protein